MMLESLIAQNLSLSIANAAGLTNHVHRIQEDRLHSLKAAISTYGKVNYKPIQSFKPSGMNPRKFNILNVKFTQLEQTLDGVSYYIIYPMISLTNHSTTSLQKSCNPFIFANDYPNFFLSIIKVETVAAAELEEKMAESKKLITQTIFKSKELEKFIRYHKVDICLFDTKEHLPLQVSGSPLVTYYSAEKSDIYNHFAVLYYVDMTNQVDIDFLNHSVTNGLINPVHQNSLLWFHNHIISNQALAYLGERGCVLEPTMLNFPNEVSNNDETLTLLSFFINYSFDELENANLQIEIFCQQQLKEFVKVVTNKTKSIDDIWLDLESSF